MLEELKQKVYETNMGLPHRGLITYTWGSVGGINWGKGLLIIKPSGVDYDVLRPSDMVVVDLKGNKVEGEINPSSDATTHMELYSRFKEIGDIVHIHSPYVAAWARAGRVLPCYGAIHADYFYGEIPCARSLTAGEIEEGCEKSTGKVIIETFQRKNSAYIPAVLYRDHDPLTWGGGTAEAVHSAVVLEGIARMSLMTELINPQAGSTSQYMQDEHFMRKHGPSTYYGQGK